ncbi:MAG: hypothetical protein L0Y67_02205 [Gammaproteobacteria bacterium]|nr:hypothetical protein [Gammaproteobacteria bacterium]MCI0590413.1 hypothetical protein [Gammaproteobacteria bacterium]
MSTVELIYDADCPNVKEVRVQLVHAFAEAGLQPRWVEWDRNSAESPAYVRGYGSPTILVDGKDVSGTLPTEANCCRIYDGPDGRAQGFPSAEAITNALDGASQDLIGATAGRVKNTGFLAALPAIGLALLPKVVCPVCWPAYTALLGVLGLEFVDYTPYLFPFTLLFLAIVLSVLGYRARASKQGGPVILGVIASIGIILGKFGYAFSPAIYGGITFLVVACGWDLWMARTAKQRACPSCENT